MSRQEQHHRMHEGRYLLFLRKEKHGMQISYADTAFFSSWDSKALVMKEYNSLKALNTGGQFWIEHNCFIVAIQVWGEMLWLDKVPPPNYFRGKPKQQGCGLRIPSAILQGMKSNDDPPFSVV